MDAKLALLMSVALPTMGLIGNIYSSFLRKLSSKSRKEHTKVRNLNCDVNLSKLCNF